MRDEEDEDSFVNDLTLTHFDEKDEVILREMMGGALQVDLDWFPGKYEELQALGEHPAQLSRETFDCQVMVHECMNEISNLNADSPYKKVKWTSEMENHTIMLVPTEIRMVQGPTGKYLRFWGYICQFFPEEDCLNAMRATIPLPAHLFKRIEMFNQNMLSMTADPLEDSKVYMILATYLGLEEYRVDDEKKRAHKFSMIKIIEGHRSDD